MTKTLPWRFQAPDGWWNRRDLVRDQINFTARSGQSQAPELLLQFYGELDQIHQCADAIKQLKGKLNEHEFSDRLRSMSQGSPEHLLIFVSLQNQRRAAHTRLRLLMQELLAGLSETFKAVQAMIRDCRARAATGDVQSLECQAAHEVLAHFCDLTENGALFRRLAGYRTLADEDPTNGEGAKALLFFSARVKPTVVASYVIGRRRMDEDIPFDLQLPKRRSNCDQIGKMYDFLEPCCDEVSKMEQEMGELEKISAVDRIGMRGLSRRAVIEHRLAPLAQIAEDLDGKIQQWLESRPKVFANASPEYQLRWSSALLAADHLRLFISLLKERMQNILVIEADMEKNVASACFQLRVRFDNTLARLTDSEGLFEPAPDEGSNKK